MRQEAGGPSGATPVAASRQAAQDITPGTAPPGDSHPLASLSPIAVRHLRRQGVAGEGAEDRAAPGDERFSAVWAGESVAIVDRHNVPVDLVSSFADRTDSGFQNRRLWLKSIGLGRHRNPYP